MLNTAKNIALSALNPKKTDVIVKKVFARFFGGDGSVSAAQNAAWLKDSAQSAEAMFQAEDPALWEEAQEKFQLYHDKDVSRIRDQIPHEIRGAGGAYAMLYFLIRKLKPEYVVETGVSLGCSTHAILTAMEENGVGALHSSDFPYFRIENAEEYIGMVVPESLRERWTLYLEGDAKSLPKILAKVPRVDFFHYDSDKSFSGRQLAYDLVAPNMAAGAPIFYDDAQDNAHFHDLVKAENLQDRFKVIEYRGKYIGMIEGKDA